MRDQRARLPGCTVHLRKGRDRKKQTPLGWMLSNKLMSVTCNLGHSSTKSRSLLHTQLFQASLVHCDICKFRRSLPTAQTQTKHLWSIIAQTYRYHRSLRCRCWIQSTRGLQLLLPSVVPEQPSRTLDVLASLHSLLSCQLFAVYPAHHTQPTLHPKFNILHRVTVDPTDTFLDVTLQKLSKFSKSSNNRHVFSDFSQLPNKHMDKVLPSRIHSMLIFPATLIAYYVPFYCSFSWSKLSFLVLDKAQSLCPIADRWEHTSNSRCFHW